MFVPLGSALLFAGTFVYVELSLAPEPVLAPFLLKQKIPVLVGASNFLVATCNFTVMYNFPTWFQTVMLTSASEAGECMLWVWPRLQLTAACRSASHTKWGVDLVWVALRWVRLQQLVSLDGY